MGFVVPGAMGCPGPPDTLQDPIRYGQLLKTLDASLRQQHGAAETQRLMEPFVALADDADFWAHTADGLALFGAAGLFRVFHLQRPVSDLAIVAESFHTKPLSRLLQSASRYQVLALSRSPSPSRPARSTRPCKARPTSSCA